MTRKIGLRWVAVAMAIAMMAAVFAACGNNEQQQTDKGQSSQTGEPAGQKLKDEEPMEMTWLLFGQTINGVPDYPPDSFVEQELEKKFNIKIEPIILPWADFQTKRDLLMASSQIPDVMYSHSDLRKDVKDGIVAEISMDMVKQNMPNYYKVINEKAPYFWFLGQVDEKLYSLIRYIELPLGAMAWRKDWLDKVGVTKVPETLEEVEDAFKRFRNDDPDGNGQKDTYGMTIGNSVLGGITNWDEIFGAFGVIPAMFNERNGQLVYGATLPETKEALKLLARWHQEELIDPEFVTDNGGKTFQKFYNGRIGYTNGPINNIDPTNARYIGTQLKAVNPKAELINGLPPKGPGGQGAYSWPHANNRVVFGKHMEKEPEKMARIMQVLDTIFSDEETATLVTIGVKGKHWDVLDPAKGVENWWKYLPPYDNPTAWVKEGISSQGMTGGAFDLLRISPYIEDKYRTPVRRELNKLYYPTSFKYMDPLSIYQLETATNYPDLGKLWPQALGQIVTGEKPIDYWDEFVKQWKASGGDEMTKEANEVYQKMKEFDIK